MQRQELIELIKKSNAVKVQKKKLITTLTYFVEASKILRRLITFIMKSLAQKKLRIKS